LHSHKTEVVQREAQLTSTLRQVPTVLRAISQARVKTSARFRDPTLSRFYPSTVFSKDKSSCRVNNAIIQQDLEIRHAFSSANEIPAERVVELITKRSLNAGIPLAKSRSSWNMAAGKRGSIIFTLEELPELGDSFVSDDEELCILRVGTNTYLINGIYIIFPAIS